MRHAARAATWLLALMLPVLVAVAYVVDLGTEIAVPSPTPHVWVIK